MEKVSIIEVEYPPKEPGFYLVELAEKLIDGPEYYYDELVIFPCANGDQLEFINGYVDEYKRAWIIKKS